MRSDCSVDVVRSEGEDSIESLAYEELSERRCDEFCGSILPGDKHVFDFELNRDGLDGLDPKNCLADSLNIGVSHASFFYKT